jgi:hypothetical protein
VQAAHEKWRRVVGRLTSWGVSVISPAFVHYLCRFSRHTLHLWSHPSRSMPLNTTSTSSETSILTVLYTTAPEVFNVPGLTTLFTYAAECRGLCVLPQPGSLPHTVYGTFAQRGASRSDYIDYVWTSCQPLSSQFIYSSGVCPSGSTLGNITGTQYVWDTSSVTRCAGFCVPR